MPKKAVNLSGSEQVEAFENAADAVREDAEEGLVEADEWGGEVTDGEVLRVLAEAYTGVLELHA